MSFRSIPGRLWFSRSAVGSVVVAVALVAGCAAPHAGSAVTADPASPATGAVTAGSVTQSVDGPTVPDTWKAAVATGPAQGILSPAGDLTATIDVGSVCFAPDGGVGGCGSLAPGAPPTFAAFSPDGTRLLVVAGTPGALGAYVLDVADAAVRVLGPAGVQDFPRGGTPPLWDLSTAAWNVDGSALYLVPVTAQSTGPVLEFDLASGAVAEPLRLDALLANSSPSIWTTSAGIALVAGTGDQRNILWWADFAAGGVTSLAKYPRSDGSIALTGADSQGGVVLICPRRADGALGATNAVVVHRQSDGSGSAAVKLLPDSLSCAGSVFSADGRYLAVTARVDAQYLLMVIDRTTGAKLLSTPLPVPVPSLPPYLTWLDDVIAVNDVTGEWVSRSLIARLDR
jgi:hypothetical protein